MNILVLNYEFPPLGGGASTVSYDICKELVKRGHVISVVTMGGKGLPGYERKDGIDIYRVKCLRTKYEVCHPWEQATYIISAVRFIEKKLNISQYDICHTHFIIPTGVVARRFNKKYGLEFFITAHGSDVIGHNNKRFKYLYKIVKYSWKKIVKTANVTVAPSEYLKDLMIKTEKDASYQVIRNGIDTNIYRFTKDKEKNILIMCRLQETKNVQLVIEAASKIELNNWKIQIVGDGPYRKVIEDKIEKYGLTEKIEMMGWIKNKSPQLLEIIQKSSIYISASRIENCPTAVLEAIACGANVILSDIPAHRQIMEKLDLDVFFNDNDSDDLANKLSLLIKKIEESHEYSNQYDLSDLGWNNRIDEYEKILNDFQ